tara:strand:- start:369 stop:632 length:264 start_codon:yes stop_codon:yes gene_type:complete
MIDTDEYETMTRHDLIEILNHWEQLAFQKTNEVFQKTNEVKRLREAILEFADYLEEKVTPYMTNDMHEVVPIGGMVSDLHKMIKGDD